MIPEQYKTYGGTGNDDAEDVLQTTDSGFIIAGFTTSTDGDVTYNHGQMNYWVIKTNDTGGIQWQKTYGGSYVDAAYSIKQTPDGGYIVAGLSYSYDGEITNHHGTDVIGVGDSSDCWVVKIDDTGKLQWEKSYGGSGNDEASSIQLTNDGGYVVAGYTRSGNGDVTNNHGAADYWVIKISDTGALQWQQTLGGSDDDIGTSVLQCTDSNYIVAGYTSSIDGDITSNFGAIDYWAVKLGSLTTTLSPTIKNNVNAVVYPTVTTGLVNINIPNAVQPQFSVKNILGENVGFSAGSGIYIIQVQNAEMESSYKILLER